MGTPAPVDIISILTQLCNQRALPTMSSELTNVGLFGKKSCITTIISDGTICLEGMCLKKDSLACQWKWVRAWLMDLVLRTHLIKKLHSVLLKGVLGETVLRKKLRQLLPWGGTNRGFHISWSSRCISQVFKKCFSVLHGNDLWTNHPGKGKVKLWENLHALWLWH